MVAELGSRGPFLNMSFFIPSQTTLVDE